MTKSHRLRNRVRAYREAQAKGRWARDPRVRLPGRLAPEIERLIEAAIDRCCKAAE